MESVWAVDGLFMLVNAGRLLGAVVIDQHHVGHCTGKNLSLPAPRLEDPKLPFCQQRAHGIDSLVFLADSSSFKLQKYNLHRI